MRALTLLEKKWRTAVLSIGSCVLCNRQGVQWAHRNQGKGIGLKTEPWMTAALCPPCHAEIDNGRDMTREDRRAILERAIVLTHARLCENGRLELV